MCQCLVHAVTQPTKGCMCVTPMLKAPCIDALYAHHNTAHPHTEATQAVAYILDLRALSNLSTSVHWHTVRSAHHITAHHHTEAVQAVAYFLDVTRMANACYFHRLLSIMQSPQGEPLLGQLEASSPAICDLLSVKPDPAHPAVCPLMPFREQGSDV